MEVFCVDEGKGLPIESSSMRLELVRFRELGATVFHELDGLGPGGVSRKRIKN